VTHTASGRGGAPSCAGEAETRPRRAELISDRRCQNRPGEREVTLEHAAPARSGLAPKLLVQRTRPDPPSGRPCLPVSVDKRAARGAFLFADHSVIPKVTTANPDTFAEVARLLEKASAEASSACVVTGGIRAPGSRRRR
jgi:hypothetical protein